MCRGFQRHTIVLITSAALIALSGCASESKRSGMTGNTGLHLTGGAGPAVFNPSTANDPNFSGTVGNDSTTWEVGAGYRFNKSVGIEVGYVDLGEFNYDGSYLGTPDHGTVKNTGYKLAVTGFVPIDNRFEAYGKLGAFRWESKDNDVFGGAPFTYKRTGSNALYGLGIQTALNPRLDMRLEWERYTKVGGNNHDVFSIKLLWYLFH